MRNQYNDLKYKFKNAPLQKKLQLLGAFFLALYCLLVLPLIHVQMQSFLQVQLSTLEQALAQQLASQVRQPLLNQDDISVQVILDDLVKNNTAVQQAAVFTREKYISAQSGDHPPRLTSQAHQIFSASNMQAGVAKWQIQIALDSTQTQQAFFTTFSTIAGIGLLLIVALVFSLQKVGEALRLRLKALTSAVAESHPLKSNAPDTKDEIKLLEAQIDALPHRSEPLHTVEPSDEVQDESTAEVQAEKQDKTSVKVQDKSSTESCRLIIDCNNLTQLQAQLSKGHFYNLLRHFEISVEQVSAHYHGECLYSTNRQVALHFDHYDTGENGVLQAILFQCALLELQHEQTLNNGVGILFTGTIFFDGGLGRTYPSITKEIQANVLRDKRVNRDEGSTASPLILDKSAAAKIPAGAGIDLEKLDDDTFIFSQLSDEQQAKLDEQLKALRTLLAY